MTITLTANVVLREALTADASEIAHVIRTAFRELASIVPRIPATVQSTESVYEKLQSSQGFVAEISGVPVGCVLCECRSNPDHLYLSRLAVLQAYRGRGIARRLIARVEDEARSHQVRTVRLDTRLCLTDNIALYQRLGYHIYGYARHPECAEPIIVNFEKDLP